MKRKCLKSVLLGLAALSAYQPICAQQAEPDSAIITVEVATEVPLDIQPLEIATPYPVRHSPVSLYALPYSRTAKSYQWGRLWANTGVLMGAYVSTLVVLECMPEDATNWSRADIRNVPPFRRWYRNVIQKGPKLDQDSPIFNYVLHPYAGAVYFMTARSCGFNFYQSLLYSSLISTIGWEFGIEAFMERPSVQDIFITPLVGSVVGELFYKLKRNIVSNDYRLGGSKVLGYSVAFVIDPVNEVLDLMRGSKERDIAARTSSAGKVTSSLMPTLLWGKPGIQFTCCF